MSHHWDIRKLLYIVMAGVVLSCHPRPVDDLALADVALKAAQKSKADSLAPDLYRKAENFYLRSKKDYAEGYYDSAKKFANEARVAAEQAEFEALQKQTQIRGSKKEIEKEEEEPKNIPTGDEP